MLLEKLLKWNESQKKYFNSKMLIKPKTEKWSHTSNFTTAEYWVQIAIKNMHKKTLL